MYCSEEKLYSYSYIEGSLADILPIHDEGLLIDRGRLYGTLRYMECIWAILAAMLEMQMS